MMLGKIKGRRRGRQRMRWLVVQLDGHVSKLQELVMEKKPGVLQSMELYELDRTERLN